MATKAEPTFYELEEYGSPDQLLTRINQMVEAKDDIHDALPLMVRFFELMLAGAEVPKRWRGEYSPPNPVQVGHWVRRAGEAWDEVTSFYPGNGYWVYCCAEGATVGSQDTGFQHSIEKPEDDDES
jgi:hypothetical protein